MGPTPDSTPRSDEGNHPIFLLSSGPATQIPDLHRRAGVRCSPALQEHSHPWIPQRQPMPMLAGEAVLTRLASDGKLWLRRALCSTGKAETQELRISRQAELSLLEEAAVRFVLLSAFSWGRVIFESHDNSHCWF